MSSVSIAETAKSAAKEAHFRNRTEENVKRFS